LPIRTSDTPTTMTGSPSTALADTVPTDSPSPLRSSAELPVSEEPGGGASCESRATTPPAPSAMPRTMFITASTSLYALRVTFNGARYPDRER
jgi:hypothetical protein